MPTWLQLLLLGGLAIVLIGVSAAVTNKQGTKQPDSERAFVGTVHDGQDVGSNGVAIHQAHVARTQAIWAQLPTSLGVTGWVGTVDEVGTTLGGDSGTLEVTLADGVSVATWNNGLSDGDDNTLIDPKSALYDDLAGLSNGDSVTFSGSFLPDDENCIDEQSVFEENSMKHPSFTFRFDSIAKS